MLFVCTPLPVVSLTERIDISAFDLSGHTLLSEEKIADDLK